jgi:hypothetical protein
VSLRCRALPVILPLVLAALPLPRSGAAATPVDSGALAHCAAIDAADERLACYDSLARPKPSPAAATKPVSPSAKASPPIATAPGTAQPTAAVTPAPAAGAVSGTSAESGKSFGLTRHPPPSAAGPDHIEARVSRVDASRLGGVRLSLDNGQVWTYNDPDALIRVGDAVTIKRGALGSFLLTTPAHHTYKAQRSQ